MAKHYYLVNPGKRRFVRAGQQGNSDNAPRLLNAPWIGGLLVKWQGDSIFFADQEWVNNCEADYKEIQEADLEPAEQPEEKAV